jgi:gluconate 5-dehydrogenase
MPARAAVVLGAAGGIGAAVARALDADGLAVVGVDVRPLDEATAALPRLLGHVVGDVRDPATIDRCFTVLRESGGGATTLVTSLLAGTPSPLSDLDEGVVHDALDVMYVSALRWSQALVRNRPPERDLSIVHISSVHATRAAPGAAAYAAAKAALESLTRTMAVEWGPLGVRCNAIAPGFVPVERNAARWSDPAVRRALTGRLPLRRAATADDVAQAVLFLASDRAAAVTGVCLPVDGGLLSSFGSEV